MDDGYFLSRSRNARSSRNLGSIPSGWPRWLFFVAFPGTPDLRGTWVRFPVDGPDGYFLSRSRERPIFEEPGFDSQWMAPMAIFCRVPGNARSSRNMGSIPSGWPRWLFFVAFPGTPDGFFSRSRPPTKNKNISPARTTQTRENRFQIIYEKGNDLIGKIAVRNAVFRSN